MSSVGNYTFEYPVEPPTRPPTIQPNATDLHLKPAGGRHTTVLGIDGVATNDPTATFAVEGQEEATVDIKDVSVPPGGKLQVRLTIDVRKLPTIAAQWTVNDVNRGKVIPTKPGRR